MENEVSKIWLVKSFFGCKYCLKTDRGRRLTNWFVDYVKTIAGDLVKLETDIGTFVYHKNNQQLLYEQYGEDEQVNIYKVTENIYSLEVECSDGYSLVELYRSAGDIVNTSVLEGAYHMGNNLIAAKEFLGNWGVLDENSNWKISPIYEAIFEFTNGFATGYISESDSTDLISLDQNGNLHIVNIDGYVAQKLTKELVVSVKNKKQGVYNTKGEKILDIAYDRIKLEGSHFILIKDDLFGLADVTGNILYKCKYYRICKTENGFAIVTRKIIDTTEYITA